MNDRNPRTIEVKSDAEPYLVRRPQGYYEYQLPVSAKGILCVDDKVLLVGNPRGELELPGGKIEKGETPEACARREIGEEVGVEVTGAELVHAWVYEILPNRHVFVVAYGVSVSARSTDEISLRIDKEVGMARWAQVDQIHECPMPLEYVHAIRKWISRLKNG